MAMEKKANLWVRVTTYLKEVRVELKRVSWPSKPDLYKTTIAVVISSVIFGVYLFALDAIFSAIFRQVIGLLK